MPEPIYVQTTDTLEIQRTKINDLVDWKADLNISSGRLEDAQTPAMHIASPVLLSYDGTPNFEVDITPISAGTGNTIIIDESGDVNLQGFVGDTAAIGTQFDLITTSPETTIYCNGTGNIYRHPPGNNLIVMNAGEIVSFRKTAADYWEIVHVADSTNVPMGKGGPGSEAGTPANYMDLTSGQKFYTYGTFGFLEGFHQPHKFFQRGMTIYLEVDDISGGCDLVDSNNLQLPFGLDITCAVGDIYEFMLVDHDNDYWRLVGSNRKLLSPLAMGASGEAAKSIPASTWTEIPTGGTGGGSSFYEEGIIGVGDFPGENMIYAPYVTKFRLYAGATFAKQPTDDPASLRQLRIEWYNGAVGLERTFELSQRGGDDDSSQQEWGIHFASPPLDGTISNGAMMKAYVRHTHGVAINADVWMAMEVIEF